MCSADLALCVSPCAPLIGGTDSEAIFPAPLIPRTSTMSPAGLIGGSYACVRALHFAQLVHVSVPKVLLLRAYSVFPLANAKVFANAISTT